MTYGKTTGERMEPKKDTARREGDENRRKKGESTKRRGEGRRVTC